MFPNKEAKEFPYRIAFVMTDGPDIHNAVIPLQHCVDVRRETVHKVLPTSWFREPSSLAGFLLT